MRQKRKRVRNNRPTMSNDSETKKLITILIIVLAVCIIFYLIAVLVNNKKEKTEPTSIQYSEILVGTLFSQGKDTYYVLAFDPSDTMSETYKSSLTALTKIKSYTIDLSSTFNSKFLTTEENFDIEGINDLKFKETTLLKIENKEITAHYTGEEITETLNSLSE